MSFINRKRAEESSEYTRLLKVLQQGRGAYMIGLVGDSLIAASFPIVIAFVLKFVFDAIVNNETVNLSQAMYFLLIGFLVNGLFSPIFGYMIRKSVKISLIKLTRQLQEHVQRLPIRYFEQHHSGDTMSRLTSDVSVMEQGYTEELRSLLTVIFSGIGSIIAMVLLNWRFTIITLIIASGSIWIAKWITRPLRLLNDRIQIHNSNFMARSSDLLAGFQTMKMFHVEQVVQGRIEHENNILSELNIQEGHKRALLECANFLQGFMSYAGVIVLGMIMVNDGQLEIGTLIALVQLQSKGVQMFAQFGSTWANLQKALAGASRIFHMLSEDVEPNKYEVGAQSGKTTERDLLKDGNMIKLSDVTFSYNHVSNSLHQLSLDVNRGQTVAFVGPSGGGKSTLIKILLGYYPPSEGQIWIGGVHLGELQLVQLRKMIAYIPQEAYLFEGTIYENIRYGNVDATEEQIVQAAKQAYAHDFIMELSDGYSTHVGERGTKLSGGQRQRIAIARALLKNAPILILDEATSALDSESEAYIQKSLQEMRKDRTTLIIAHRLSTIQDADVICYLRDGRIVEQGSHQSLIENRGLYYQLYDKQFDRQTAV